MKTLSSISRLLVVALLLATATISCDQEPVTPEVATPEVPRGVLVFENVDALKETLENMKNGNGAIVASNQEGFESLYNIWEKCKAEEAEIMAPLNALTALSEQELIQHSALIEKTSEKLAQLKSLYERHIVFEDQRPVRLKFKDELMAHLINTDGFLIIGNNTLKYSNEEILHASFENPEEALEPFKSQENQSVDHFEIPSAQISEGRTDDFQAGCGTSINTSYNLDIVARVTQTFVPVFRNGTPYWVDRCEPSSGYCFGGHWVTPRILVGYNLTNTRVYANMKTTKNNCAIGICWRSAHRVRHEFRITGAHNETVTRSGVSTTTISKDISPRSSGSISVSGIADNLATYTCTAHLSW